MNGAARRAPAAVRDLLSPRSVFEQPTSQPAIAPALNAAQRAEFLRAIHRARTPAERIVAIQLLQMDHGRGAFPSHRYLCEVTGLALGTVKNAVSTLLRVGAFWSSRRPGLGNLCAYTAKPVPWTQVIQCGDLEPKSSSAVTSRVADVTVEVIAEVIAEVTVCGGGVVVGDQVTNKASAPRGARAPDGGAADAQAAEDALIAAEARRDELHAAGAAPAEMAAAQREVRSAMDRVRRCSQEAAA